MATKKKKTTKTQLTPLEQTALVAKREKANARAKERRDKVKAIKELREQARDSAEIGTINDNGAVLAEAKELFMQADKMEQALGSKKPVWEQKPDGRWVRNIDLGEGATITAKIEVALDGWVQGMCALEVNEMSIMTSNGFIADGEKAIELFKVRFGHIIAAYRAIVRKTL